MSTHPLLDHPLLVPALFVLILLLTAMLLWRAGRPGRRSRRRAALAGDGEQRARLLLESAGYRIEACQERAVWWIEVDGRSIEVEVRADYIVTRGGRRLVAEVKTGAMAPSPVHPATRRQLLEYAVAFAVDDVLLVDADARALYLVRFPALAPK